jgi:hypothetical protein
LKGDVKRLDLRRIPGTIRIVWALAEAEGPCYNDGDLTHPRAGGKRKGEKMRGSVKSWVIVGTLVLALLFGGAYAFTPLHGGAVPGMMSGGMIGPGMMGQSPGMGSGMMGGCPMGSSMMGWYPGFVARDMEQAAQAAQRYLAAFWRDPDLAIKEVMEFSNQFYVQIKEQSTELGAMELIVEKFNGLVHPEPGPNMMWNS